MGSEAVPESGDRAVPEGGTGQSLKVGGGMETVPLGGDGGSP